MRQYLDLCKDIRANGTERQDRTGTGTYSVFGRQNRYDLREGFPLLTTKEMYLKGIIVELLWFIRGDTNIRYLVENGVNIWNKDALRKYNQNNKEMSQEEFKHRILTDNIFAEEHGDLGPVYGAQWRNFGGVDQLKELIQNIKDNPNSRDLILSAWNVPMLPRMTLKPCHVLLQMYVEDEYLSGQMYQRSADIFLGVPFNIASYSLLIMLIARELGLKPKEFVHSYGDAHIYKDHIDQIDLQLTREPRELPRLILNPEVKSMFDFKYEDFKLEGYDPFESIKGNMST